MEVLVTLDGTYSDAEALSVETLICVSFKDFASSSIEYTSCQKTLPCQIRYTALISGEVFLTINVSF